MAGPKIEIRFDGRDADRNAINMKYYALALQGAEEILSDGLILLAYQRLPKPREKAPILVKVRESKEGSHITPTDLGEAWDMLQLGIPIVQQIGADWLYEWVKAVVSCFSGKTSDMEVALARMVELNRDHLAARDRNDERVHEERMVTLEILRDAVKALGPSAERYAAPVGRSVTKSEFRTQVGSVPLIESDAEAIREQSRVVWEKIAPICLRTDGFKFHTSGLSVENPEGEGFMMAVVKDPTFVEEENAYTEAAQRRARIEVLARKGRRNGILARLEILEFQSELGD